MFRFEDVVEGECFGPSRVEIVRNGFCFTDEVPFVIGSTEVDSDERVGFGEEVKVAKGRGAEEELDFEACVGVEWLHGVSRYWVVYIIRSGWKDIKDG